MTLKVKAVAVKGSAETVSYVCFAWRQYGIPCLALAETGKTLCGKHAALGKTK
jgi:hypothetical protein